MGRTELFGPPDSQKSRCSPDVISGKSFVRYLRYTPHFLQHLLPVYLVEILPRRSLKSRPELWLGQ